MNTENSRHTLPAVFLYAAPIRFTAGKGKRQEYGEISPWKNHFLETEGPVYCMKKRIAAAIVRFRIGILICILIIATWSVFQIGRTKINYDLTRYLSDDTMTKKALAVMQEEFGTTEQLRLMFENQDETALKGIMDRLQEMPEILAGLLNSRGLLEEASVFRDEYYLRGVDFVRIHITVNDLLLADHDHHISAESRLIHATEIFHLFDDLPISYSAYHVTHSDHTGTDDAVIFYVNHKFEEFGGVPAAKILGHSVRELYPHIGEEWFREIKRAALDGETVEGEMTNALDGERYHYTVRQIIYPGYCAVTYQKIG